MKFFLVLSFVLMLVASYFSVGCYHSDEYGQILKFVHFKMGLVPAQEMPWEFLAQMRPWLQPAIYFGLAKVFAFSNPFHQAFVFRLFSGLVGWASTVALASCLPFWFVTEKWRRFALYSLALSFFVPMFQVRTSSENFSACMLVFAVALMTHHKPRRQSSGVYGGLGFLLGLAFAFRYQAAFAGIGLILWLLVVPRIGLRSLMKVVLGGVCAIALSSVVDYWGYGTWTLAPWNYYYHNIVLGAASKWFGSSPWWYWVVLVFRFVVFPLGLYVLVLVPLFWWFYPWHILTLSSLVFVLGHVVVAHKEFRFLFPLAYFVPVMMALAGERLAAYNLGIRGASEVMRWFYRVGLGVNFVLLGYFLLTPQRNHLTFLNIFASTFPEVRDLYWQAEEKLDPHYFYFPEGARIAPVNRFSEISPKGEFYYYRRIPQSLVGEDRVSAGCTRIYLDLISRGIDAEVAGDLLRRLSPIRHEMYRCRAI